MSTLPNDKGFNSSNFNHQIDFFRATKQRRIKFEVLTEVSILMLLSWILAPCGFLGRWQRFGETVVSIFRAEVTMLGSGGLRSSNSM
jgi:hypothetical protein